MVPEIEPEIPQVTPLTDFRLPPDFCMPTMEEIEQILALGDQSWLSLLRSGEPRQNAKPLADSK